MDEARPYRSRSRTPPAPCSALKLGVDAPELLLDLLQARGQVQHALLRLLHARVLDVRKAQHARRAVRKHRHVHLVPGTQWLLRGPLVRCCIPGLQGSQNRRGGEPSPCGRTRRPAGRPPLLQLGGHARPGAQRVAAAGLLRGGQAQHRLGAQPVQAVLRQDQRPCLARRRAPAQSTRRPWMWCIAQGVSSLRRPTSCKKHHTRQAVCGHLDAQAVLLGGLVPGVGDGAAPRGARAAASSSARAARRPGRPAQSRCSTSAHWFSMRYGGTLMVWLLKVTSTTPAHTTGTSVSASHACISA